MKRAHVRNIGIVEWTAILFSSNMLSCALVLRLNSVSAAWCIMLVWCTIPSSNFNSLDLQRTSLPASLAIAEIFGRVSWSARIVQSVSFKSGRRRYTIYKLTGTPALGPAILLCLPTFEASGLQSGYPRLPVRERVHTLFVYCKHWYRVRAGLQFSVESMSVTVTGRFYKTHLQHSFVNRGDQMFRLFTVQLLVEGRARCANYRTNHSKKSHQSSNGHYIASVVGRPTSRKHL